MAAVDLVEPRAREAVSAGMDRGILVNATSETTLRFLPPLTVTDEEIDRVGEVLLWFVGAERG
ncbi:MAG: Acetylornithine aminotransferase [Actinobacteria bacterium ADurb.Bin444]|nr:MAG: Acetylornithine aminotransferase [Actinobacteria bacterium ADurb.Bin444]